MATASSEAGHVNIGSAEISSHLEIEPEIKVGKAIGDSDEVCGLERKECDEIMEHLKSNPGLVVKSLGLEGQIVLHVAVMAGETKKEEPPSSKHIDKGLREAAHDSEWYHALRVKDCKSLIALLQANHCLVGQTGPRGWTVLHVAVYRGCLSLIDQVYILFKEKFQFEDEISGVKVDWRDFFKAKYSLFEVEAQDIFKVDTLDMAWFTCPREVCQDLSRSYKSTLEESFSLSQQSSFEASQHLRDKLVGIMEGEASKKAFKSLEEEYQSDLEYNFVLERKKLKVHYAIKMMWFSSPGENYVKNVIGGCLDLGPSESVEVLTYLFELQNAQGQTLLHLASLYGRMCRLLKLVPPGDAYIGCLNAKDVRGWTALHYVVAIGEYYSIDELLGDGRIDVNTRATSGQEEFLVTPLHLAILHDNVRSVELLLECPRTNVNALLKRDIAYGYRWHRLGDDLILRLNWLPLQLAAIMGLSNVVRALLGPKLCDIYDDGKLKNKIVVGDDFQRELALLLACAPGNLDTVRVFLDNPMFNPLVKLEGATALHYATNARPPKHKYDTEYRFGHLLHLSDLGRLDAHDCRPKEEQDDVKLTPRSYLGRQACITMLLQAGVDIWEKNNEGRFADPGPQAPKEAQLWWHEKMAQETLEAKKNLNDAANAIAVVAALVATASFVGPLQPPLGYGGDSMEGGIQDTNLCVRVFMVSNNLSFYLAIASILFAVVPSLPMPQEGIYDEWLRTRRTVAMAIFFLLMSVLGILLSFGAASNCVVSKEYSW